MTPGALLTMRETDSVRRKLNAISKNTTDRKILEQCRMINLSINKAQRRVIKKLK